MSQWLNTTKVIHKGNGKDFPCKVLGYCPYGMLVEEFPLDRKKISCPIFGHDCPVFYHAEDIKPSRFLEIKKEGG